MKESKNNPMEFFRQKVRLIHLFWIILGMFFWYLSIPGLITWYLFTRTEISKTKKTALSLSAFLFFIMIHISLYNSNKPPIITILEPNSTQAVQSDKTTLSGNVDPKSSIIKINDKQVEVDENGNFSKEVGLDKENNNFIIIAINKDKEDRRDLLVRKALTEEERAEIEKEKQRIEEERKKQEEERRIKKEEEAKKKAEEETQRKIEEEKRLAEEEKVFKAECKKIPYKQLEKDASSYKGEKVVYQGKIEQAERELGIMEWFRISVTPQGYGYYSDTIWVDYLDVTDFVEGDIVTFWGEVAGDYCYKSQAGWNICIPSVNALYMSK